MNTDPENPPKNKKQNEDRAGLHTPLEFLVDYLADMKTEADASSSSDKLKSLISRSLKLATGLNTYPVSMSSELSSDAKLLAKKTGELDFEALHKDGITGSLTFFKEMSSSFIQGGILKMLVKMVGARRVLEIGTFTGFAALNMAEALPSDGCLVTMELMPFFSKFSRDFFDQTQQKDKIQVQTGDAIALLTETGEKGAQFDFIFIDADKIKYTDYFKIVLDKGILAPKGTIVFDNTMYKGATYMDEYPRERIARSGPVVHEFNKLLKNESRVEQVILPVQDGLTIVRRVGE